MKNANDDGLKWIVKSIEKKKAGYDDDDQKVVMEELAVLGSVMGIKFYPQQTLVVGRRNLCKHCAQ